MRREDLVSVPNPVMSGARLSLLVAIALVVLVLLGIWQGDFRETVMNGTAL